ncbi:NUDIX domain-containing protein [Sulfitobacter sp. R18_1]|uniref:NUDIX domain-containing protein n=1 Tax=Sulfitobacter sp. R18_1 TaxID=2821104 RepID=UPI001AD96AE2|nr:NUDIX domain-containing protein [Sulfitobacter sp. R18_1]MBO9428579.1 NUDIX domain-containing protein [Sulfitobacter sp. R18_1]
MTKTKIAVIVGRFQGPTKGHCKLFQEASKISDRIITLVGSSFRPRSEKNPWLYRERKEFLKNMIMKTGNISSADVSFLPLIDTLYDDDAWRTNVRTAVNLMLRKMGYMPGDVEVILVGHQKDDNSGEFLDPSWFPDWTIKTLEAEVNGLGSVHASDLREALFSDEEIDRDYLMREFGLIETCQLVDWVKNPANAEAVATIKAERAYNKSYRDKYEEVKKLWGHDFPAQCADAVVIQSGHILLVERKNNPGKGNFALPGGHLQNETAEDGCIRELREETRLKVPPRILRNRIRDRRTFDHPERSERGWVRTDAFLIDLEDQDHLEKVKGKKVADVEGADDAARAFWVPISELTPDNMFEDHFDIIQALVPNVPFAYSSVLMAEFA